MLDFAKYPNLNGEHSYSYSIEIDEHDVENSDSKRMDSDDEQNKRENSDSLDIKRERNESGSSKADENDTESDAHGGKSQVLFISVKLVFYCRQREIRSNLKKWYMIIYE